MVTKGHEKVDLPAGVAVHRVHLQREASVFSIKKKSTTVVLNVSNLTSLQPGWSVSS